MLDIGPKAAAEFGGVISGAATVFWCGPMGLFEWPRFADGTEAVARAVAGSGAFSVVGGADTVRVLDGLGLLADVSWSSADAVAAVGVLFSGDSVQSAGPAFSRR